MSSRDPIEFPEAIALFLRTFREKHGITQPQLQRRAREHYGATWSRGTVSGFEAGRGSMTVPTLLILAASLSDLSGKELSLGDLIPNDLQISITPGLTVSGNVLSQYLSGNPAALADGEGITRDPSSSEIADEIHEMIRYYPAFPTAQDAVDANREVRKWSVSLAIERASERLGIPPQVFQLWSLKLWGRSLDDEVTHRVGPDASPQKRGHATRQLVKEVDKAIGPRNG